MTDITSETGFGTGAGPGIATTEPAGVRAATIEPTAAAIATFAWVTGPSLPGLEIRIEILVFDG
jgi:hypothetical protein